MARYQFRLNCSQCKQKNYLRSAAGSKCNQCKIDLTEQVQSKLNAIPKAIVESLETEKFVAAQDIRELNARMGEADIRLKMYALDMDIMQNHFLKNVSVDLVRVLETMNRYDNTTLDHKKGLLVIERIRQESATLFVKRDIYEETKCSRLERVEKMRKVMQVFLRETVAVFKQSGIEYTESTCGICWDAAPDHANVGCGHRNFCKLCLLTQEQCPICGAVITDVIKIYT